MGLHVIASASPLAFRPSLGATDLASYAPIGIIILMAIAFGVGNIVATRVIGPSRRGAVKGVPYESGMNPFTSARKRFNVRFYILAMTFLVFDVEIIFLFPWASAFTQLEARSTEAGLFLLRALFFLLTTIVAYLYAYKKGVFRFD